MIFDDVSERSEVFLDLKNDILGYSKKHFSKKFGQIFFEFVFLRKRLDDVLDRKEGLLKQKKIHFKIVRKLTIFQGG